jgi:hypothetical protein
MQVTAIEDEALRTIFLNKDQVQAIYGGAN